MKKAIISILGLIMAASAVCSANSPRPMEYLNRGLVVTPMDGGKAFISWRLFSYDPDNTSFDIYRSEAGAKAVKINSKPVDGPTWYIDEDVDPAKSYEYFVKVKKGTKGQSETYALKAGAKPYISIPLNTPQGYQANDCSVGDLDGDGEMEIVVHMTGRSADNAFNGFTDAPILQAYKLNGKMLWEINLGTNIREGAHYTQFVVYDFDGDGKAEMICKTADGSKDGLGNVIGDPNADWRTKEGVKPTHDRTGSSRDENGNMVARIDGRIMDGPEYLTVFAGPDGKAIDTVDYLSERGEIASWGDEYANRSERYLACAAYLDGVHPSAVMCRGYYARASVAAWDFDGSHLKLRWLFDTMKQPQWKAWEGQGAHSVQVADVDNDGCDEIMYGAAVIDNDGTGLYSTGLMHGDALHVGDLDPDRPGLEVFMPHETPSKVAGAEARDARTGELLWGLPTTKDNGRGVSFNIDPRYAGSECWSSADNNLYSIKGEVIGQKPRSTNFSIYWDGDLLQELLDGDRISKWNWEKSQPEEIFVAKDCMSNNGSKSTPSISGDILGDWREELVLRTRDSKELRIFTTTIPTDVRLYTLLNDPQYRMALVWQQTSYNQPPHTSFYMDPSVKTFPKPNITVIKKK